MQRNNDFPFRRFLIFSTWLLIVATICQSYVLVTSNRKLARVQRENAAYRSLIAEQQKGKLTAEDLTGAVLDLQEKGVLSPE